jgi:ring-1,2-phenylacetyl-CoA epoxidase subunit PaaC
VRQSQTVRPDVATYVLRLGDDCLILSQRLCQWSGWGPSIEEDIALTNIALDLVGQTRNLLTRAGELEGDGRSEDDLAYLRSEREFLNLRLVEQQNGDFAHTIARQFLFSTYQLALYDRLRESSDPTLAGVAAKGVKEVAYHRDHARQWMLRLGDGTEESHARLQDALDRLWPFSGEMFARDDVADAAVSDGVGVDASRLRPEWDDYIDDVLDQAKVTRPHKTWHPSSGRQGEHGEDFGFLIAEMQHLHRAHPGAQW